MLILDLESLMSWHVSISSSFYHQVPVIRLSKHILWNIINSKKESWRMIGLFRTEISWHPVPSFWEKTAVIITVWLKKPKEMFSVIITYNRGLTCSFMALLFPSVGFSYGHAGPFLLAFVCLLPGSSSHCRIEKVESTENFLKKSWLLQFLSCLLHHEFQNKRFYWSYHPLSTLTIHLFYAFQKGCSNISNYLNCSLSSVVNILLHSFCPHSILQIYTIYVLFPSNIWKLVIGIVT